jgi:hypothetical protein
MNTTLNGHNSEILFFLYETYNLSDKVRQRKGIFHSGAKPKKQFESF